MRTAITLLLGASMLSGGDAGDWRAEADRRIDRIRRGDIAVTLRGADGALLADAPVSLRLVRHRFGFGTCVNTRLLREDADGERYRAVVLRHCNTLVCENEMKWYAVEKERGVLRWEEGDRMLAFAQRHGLSMRGHCLFWDKLKFVRFQPWVEGLGDAELRAAVESRLRGAVSRYAGRLSAWDVNNELLDGGFYGGRLGADVQAWMFREAQRIDPATPLFVNEYGILDSDEKLARYEALIDGLRAAGAPVGGIGIQEHAAERFVPDAAAAAADADKPERQGRGPLIPSEVWARLDRLGRFRLPIHLTEISSKTADDLRRADTLEMLLRVAFAHERVDAVLLWGFWAKAHWLGRDAALYDADWKPLPAAERLAHLLEVEWTTTVEARTDAQGVVRFRGFHGDYEASAHAGTRLAGRFRHEPGRDAAEIRLEPAP